MQFSYGEQTPLRLLDEANFWKQQESEHTVVIRELLPDLEEPFVKQLENWQLLLSQTQATAISYIETVNRLKGNVTPDVLANIKRFIVYCCNQSTNFIALLNKIALESQAVKENPIVMVVINHIRRESEYFIGIVSASMQHF